MLDFDMRVVTLIRLALGIYAMFPHPGTCYQQFNDHHGMAFGTCRRPIGGNPVINGIFIRNKFTCCRRRSAGGWGHATHCKPCSSLRGHLLPWGEWSPCSQSCGWGKQKRFRYCSNGVCAGIRGKRRMDTRSCMKKECCPVHGNWSDWSKWSECSASCGDGLQYRTRSCTSPAPSCGGKQCLSYPRQMQRCRARDCSHWSSWTLISGCSVSCGEGFIARSRECLHSNEGGSCVGAAEDFVGCHAGSCQVNGGWCGWGSWSRCTSSCSHIFGTRKRARSCSCPSPMGEGDECKGEDGEAERCTSTAQCAVNGGWSEWSAWSNCDAKICSWQPGTQQRKRLCSNPPPKNGGVCIGEYTGKRPCLNFEKCTVNGTYGDWSLWSECSTTCGMCGTRTRLRDCSSPLKHSMMTVIGAPHVRCNVWKTVDTSSCILKICPDGTMPCGPTTVSPSTTISPSTTESEILDHTPSETTSLFMTTNETASYDSTTSNLTSKLHDTSSTSKTSTILTTDKEINSFTKALNHPIMNATIVSISSASTTNHNRATVHDKSRQANFSNRISDESPGKNPKNSTEIVPKAVTETSSSKGLLKSTKPPNNTTLFNPTTNSKKARLISVNSTNPSGKVTRPKATSSSSLGETTSLQAQATVNSVDKIVFASPTSTSRTNMETRKRVIIASTINKVDQVELSTAHQVTQSSIITRILKTEVPSTPKMVISTEAKGLFGIDDRNWSEGGSSGEERYDQVENQNYGAGLVLDEGYEDYEEGYLEDQIEIGSLNGNYEDDYPDEGIVGDRIKSSMESRQNPYNEEIGDYSSGMSGDTIENGILGSYNDDNAIPADLVGGDDHLSTNTEGKMNEKVSLEKRRDLNSEYDTLYDDTENDYGADEFNDINSSGLPHEFPDEEDENSDMDIFALLGLEEIASDAQPFDDAPSDLFSSTSDDQPTNATMSCSHFIDSVGEEQKAEAKECCQILEMNFNDTDFTKYERCLDLHSIIFPDEQMAGRDSSGKRCRYIHPNHRSLLKSVCCMRKNCKFPAAFLRQQCKTCHYQQKCPSCHGPILNG